MTTVAAPTPRGATPSGSRWVAIDAWLMTKRCLVHTVRQPDLLVFSTIQPVMFVLLFRYVFGGAIQTGGAPYVDYLMPGIFVQTTVFGSLLTGLGLSTDLQRGIVDRFRSLPMSRSAVLLGRTTSDALRNLFILLLMLAVGVLVGFRIHGGLLATVAGLGLILLFGLAFSWISALIGLLIKSPEAVQSAGFIWVFPLTFLSSAFVPLTTMPDWLRAFAQVNPFTITVDAARLLMLGPESASIPGLPASVATTALASVAWSVGLLVVFVPLAVLRYRRTV